MDPSHGDSSSEDASPDFADIVDQMMGRVAAGQSVDLESLCSQYPQIAPRLRNLFPAIVAMAELKDGSQGGIPPETQANHSLGLPGTLGDFRIVRQLGRGGMGVVFEAEQISLSRRVALKVLPFASALDKRSLQRFKNESLAAAMLKHTNIVTVYAVGMDRGVHFYAMELIEGQTMAEVIAEARRESPLGKRRSEGGHSQAETVRLTLGSTWSGKRHSERVDQAARWARQVCDGLQHAHEQGVIHRDIKPSNLLLDAHGNVFITDFGLAQVQFGGSDLTVSGDLLGTLRYMSPEQAEGTKLIDHRTDVFSLGLVLYEYLTLKPTFDATDRPSLLDRILHAQFIRPRDRNPSIPVDLETVLLKALARDAAERYQSAAELSEDLQRYLERLPVAARRPTRLDHFQRWVRRNPTVAAMVATIMLLMTALATTASISAVRQRENAQQAVQLNLDLQAKNYSLTIAAAYQAWERGNLSRAKMLLATQHHVLSAADNSPFEFWHLWNRLQNDTDHAILDNRHRKEVKSLRYAFDGRQLAMLEPNGMVQIHDAMTGACVFEKQLALVPPATATAIGLSSDGHRLAIGTSDGAILIVQDREASEPIVVRTGEQPSRIESLSFAPNGSHIAAVDVAGRIWLCELKEDSGAVDAHRVDQFEFCNPDVAFSPDGEVLATSGGWAYAQVRLWRTADLKRIATLPLPSNKRSISVSAIAFSPDGTWLASVGDMVSVHRTVDWSVVWQKDQPLCSDSIAFSQDGERFAVTDSRSVRVFRSRDGTELQKRQDPQGVTELLGFVSVSEFEANIVALRHSGVVSLLPLQLSLAPQTLSPSYSGRYVGVEFFATGPFASHVAVSAGQGFADLQDYGRLLLWNPSTDVATVLAEGPACRCAIALSNKYPTMVAVGTKFHEDDWGVEVWDVAKRARVNRFTGLRSTIYDLKFSGDGQYLVGLAIGQPSSNQRGAVAIWDFPARRLIRLLELEYPMTFEFVPGQHTLAILSNETGWTHPMKLFDIERNAWDEPWCSILPTANVARYNPKGSFLAVGATTGAFQLWDNKQSELRFETPSTGMLIVCAAFSPDERTLVLGSVDQTMTLWDVVTGSLLCRVDLDRVPVTIRFSPDGKSLVAGCVDGSVRWWSVSGNYRLYPLMMPDLTKDATEALHQEVLRSNES
jgi:serine/threonine protein kinase/WD40 repeat protein